MALNKINVNQAEVRMDEGAFNVSMYYAVGNQPATYDTLADAIAAVPEVYRNGGMTIRFFKTVFGTFNIVRANVSSAPSGGILIDSEITNPNGNFYLPEIECADTDVQTELAGVVNAGVTKIFYVEIAGDTATYRRWTVKRNAKDTLFTYQYRNITNEFSLNEGDWVYDGIDEGIYDISLNNMVEVEGVMMPSQYETLSSALADIPVGKRKGGMNIKYQELTPATYAVVKTEGLAEEPTGTEILSDPNIVSGNYTASQLYVFATLPSTINSSLTYYFTVTGDTTTYTSWVITKSTDDTERYVQYRLMNTIWSITPSDWQGVDDEPTAGSDNLIQSGNAAAIEETKFIKISGNLIDPDRCLLGKYLTYPSGNVGNAVSDDWRISNYIPVCGKNISFNCYAGPANSIASYAVYDKNLNILRVGKLSSLTPYIYQEGDYAIRVQGSNANFMANYGDVLLPYVPYDDIAEINDDIAEINDDIAEINDDIAEINDDINGINNIALQWKADIDVYNLIDPSNCVMGAALRPNGNAESGYPSYCVTNYIPVKGNNVITNNTLGYSENKWTPFVVYDNNLNLLRASSVSTNQYTYQDGDFYVRFCIQYNNDTTRLRANYGNTLYAYKEFTKTYTLDNVQANIVGIGSQLSVLNNNKLDKVYSTNLINPDELRGSKYISPQTGNILNGDNNYCVSGYISVFDKDGEPRDIISNACVLSFAGSFVVYDRNKTKLRFSVNTTTQYIYEEGDYYVIFGFNKAASDVIHILANYGTELLEYTPYTEYKPLTDLEVRVDTIEEELGQNKDDLSLSSLNCLYQVWNSALTSRQYMSRIWLSHFISNNAYKNKEIFFDNGLRCYPFYPTSVETKSESNVIVNVTPHKNYNNTTLSFKNRITNSAVSKSIAPRIMIIGDSVTSGYGAGANKDVAWLPSQYWAYAKMLFEMDKIDGGDNSAEYNATFMGVISSGNFTINYEGISRNIRARADGKGGAHLDELFNPTWGDSGGTFNPFYDEINQTFSVAAYLANYRTMDDLGVRLVSNSSDPHGESVIGSDGNTYTIGNKITTQTLLSTYDVCTPTHVFINMNHNTSLVNYQTYIGQVINIIKTEINVPIIIMLIDETGTYFPIDYPYQQPSTLNIGSLHTKNLSIYEYCKENVEDEENGVYLLGTNFVQPTARAYPTKKYVSSDSMEKNEKEPDYLVADTSVVGANWHPNNYAHAAWGYSLYAMIKWLITSNE